MAMNLKTLNNKLEKNINGEDIIDLTTKSSEFVDNLKSKSYVHVEERMEMRPDLFALEYGDTSGDFTTILKYNNISNPFTLSSDDIIFLPTGNVSSLSLSPKEDIMDENGDDIRNSYVDPSKASTPDPKISTLDNKYKDALNVPASTSPRKTSLPPNFNDFSEGEVEVKNNKLRFAPGVSRNSSECSTEPISKSDLISRVIKNKIGG